MIVLLIAMMAVCIAFNHYRIRDLEKWRDKE